MDNLTNVLQAEASGVKFPESKGAGVYLRSGRVRIHTNGTGRLTSSQ